MEGHAGPGAGTGGSAKKKKAKMCEATTSLTDLDRVLEGSTKSKIMDTGLSHSHGERDHNSNKRRATSAALLDSHHNVPKQNQVGNVLLFGVPIVSLVMDGKERLCLAQISSTLLKEFSYNEIHNRRVALGITCIQCTPVQLEILRRAGAMPVTSRRCGMITRREAERLCQSFLGDHAPPQLPENFAFEVYHECAWGCRGAFVPSRYNSSRAKCIRCSFCQLFFSPNKFIFHSHRLPDSRYVQPDAANFNSWRRHLKLCGDPPEEVSPSSSPGLFPKIPQQPTTSTAHPSLCSLSKEAAAASGLMATAQIVHAWEDVKAMFNGGTRKRLLAAHSIPSSHIHRHSHNNSAGSSSSSHRPSSSGNHNHNNNNNNQNNNQNHSKMSQNSGSSTPVSLNSNNNNNNNNNNSAMTPTTSSTSSRPGHGGHGGQNHSHPYGSGGHSHSHSYMDHLSSPSSFMNVQSPLLSPTASRLDTIWNPGISSAAVAAAAAAAAVSRQCQQLGVGVGVSVPTNTSSGTSGLPPLPFHPLSIPWLRRPLFPFSHPFGPSCKLFGEGGGNQSTSSTPNNNSNANPGQPPVNLNSNNPASASSSSSSAGNHSHSHHESSSSSAGAAAKNSQNMSSAFKPVVTNRGAEQLLSWMSNNNNGINIHNIDGLLHTTSSMSLTLPEDLSLSSSCPPGSSSGSTSVSISGSEISSVAVPLAQNLNQSQSIYNNSSILLQGGSVINPGSNNSHLILPENVDPLIMSKHLPPHLTHLSGENLHNHSRSHQGHGGRLMEGHGHGHGQSHDPGQNKKYTSHLIQQVISHVCSNSNNDSNNNEDREDTPSDNEDDEDDENVDIESTEVDPAEECCSSTSASNFHGTNNNNRSCSSTPTPNLWNNNGNQNQHQQHRHHQQKGSSLNCNSNQRLKRSRPSPSPIMDSAGEDEDDIIDEPDHDCRTTSESESDAELSATRHILNQNQNQDQDKLNMNLSIVAAGRGRNPPSQEGRGGGGGGGGGGAKRKRIWDCDKRVVHIKSSSNLGTATPPSTSKSTKNNWANNRSRNTVDTVDKGEHASEYLTESHRTSQQDHHHRLSSSRSNSTTPELLSLTD